ncbi:MAG TPA: alpha/beta fold hydrolase [Acidimicrobiales bacterium]|nr:alpha/beta fold hydrolase [Acidimicrobiales bacterium]
MLPDGRRIDCPIYGDPDGFPVLYCHGGLSAPVDIAFADEAARERGVRIVAPARPGIGSSDRCRDRRVADWASDVSAVVAALGIDRFSVLGWSAGGPFALAVAAGLAPLVVRGATVGGMAPLWPPLSARQLGLRLDQVLFPLSRRSRRLAALVVRASALAPAGVERGMLLRALPPEDGAVVEKMTPAEVADGMRDATRHGPGGVADDYAVLADEWGFGLADVGAPVTVFQGAADTLLPRSHAEALAAALPSGRLEVVEGSGHFLLHSHLAQVFDALVG